MENPKPPLPIEGGALHSEDAALIRASWQSALFSRPTRSALAALSASWPCRILRVNVHRNHGFEAVSSASTAFASWNGLEYVYAIGAYDDSLAFALTDASELELVWLDVDHYAGLGEEDSAAWLVGRMRDLRSRTTNPILLAAWPLGEARQSRLADAAIPGLHLADLDALARDLEGRWTDLRTASISGTRLSNLACMHIARELACRWLPACILSPIKAIAVDLDETLYRGILGEDGIEAVVLTPAHRRLQQRIADYARQGIFVALVSRNELVDVEALFAGRTDFPLRLDNFSVVEVSWGDKGAALERVAQKLHIGLDSVVYVDDNPGELAAVASRLPVVTVHAKPEPAETLAALEHVAGLWRWNDRAEDALRVQDLKASSSRESVALAAGNPEEYLRVLNTRLVFLVDCREHLGRIAELVRKTNQFNLSLSRMREAEIAQRMVERTATVVAIRLSDRLSDSGIVAVIVGRREADTLLVEEVSVSCRALGRHLEDSMLTQALLLMGDASETRRVSFAVSRGPRNQPALSWCAAYSGSEIGGEISRVSMPYAAIVARGVSPAVIVEVQG